MARILLVVTGASRGFGRATCEAFFEELLRANKTNNSDTIVQCCLVARSSQGLTASKAYLQAVMRTSDCSCLVTTNPMDLSDLDMLDTRLNEIINSLTPREFDKLILINNAGSIGEIGSMATQSASIADWKRTIDLNVTSMFWTTRRWGQWAIQHNIEAILVNISSLVAIQPFPSMSLYSAGKAARDMYYSCLAKELSNETPAIRLLNYAPGPLETDMVEELRAAPALHHSLKASYAQKQLNPADSARALVQLLQGGDFVSGSHIDYYDLAE